MKTTRSRFLDPAKIDATIREVSAIALKSGNRIALAGGVALQFYGSDRFTNDVDFVSDGFFRGLKNPKDLSFGGVRGKSPGGVSVDIIVRSDQYQDLYDAALANAPIVTSLHTPVVSLPYLGAMKMVAGRGKDAQDLAWILVSSKVDYDRLRAIVKEHLGPYAADELDATRKIARWEKRRSR